MLIDDHLPTNVLHKLAIEETNSVNCVMDFTDAEEALQYMQEDFTEERLKPNIIFLDINMPGMNGWEFLDEYRKLPKEKLSEVTVLMLSTSSHPDDLSKAETDELVDDYIYKPLTSEMMLAIIDNYLSL